MVEGKKILIVEDEDGHYELIRRGFERVAESFQIERAASLREARERVGSGHPDLIITDWKLPDGDGIELIEKDASGYCRCPVVVMTSHGNEAWAVEAMKLGALDYFVKSPQAFAEISRLAQRALNEWSNTSARRRAELALAESRQDWEDIFQAIGQPAMILSLEHDILAVNQATVRVTGKSAAELISRKCYEIFHADQGSVPPSCCPLMNMLKSQKTHVEEMEVEAMGGCFLVSCTPVFEQDGKLAKVIHIALDITEKKKLEERLGQTQKMEAIGALAGGIAHDFNNILSPIVGYTELAQMRAQSDPVLGEYLDRVTDAATRATALVRQILAFSRRSELKKLPLQVSTVLKEALKLLRSSIPTSIEIRQEIATQALVLADPTSIHQIVMNLCTNAYQSMEATGGVLAVALKEVEFTQEQLAGEEIAPGRYVVLEVSDTGCGMDKEIQEKIFEPYFTTKALGKGTGLGLAVVHGIVKDHRGRITVYSEPGRGTTFKVYLPATADRPGEMPGVQNEVALAAGHERILFVDDEESICALAKNYLSKCGYVVDVCNNGRDALFAIEQELGAYDLLITDMTMPGMTGKELTQKVLALRPDLPVLLCTGYSSLIDSEEAAELGIRDYIEKPVGMSELASRIKKALG